MAKEKTPELPFEIEHPSKITLFSHPIITIKIFLIVLFNYLVQLLKFVLKYWYLFGLVITAIVAPY